MMIGLRRTGKVWISILAVTLVSCTSTSEKTTPLSETLLIAPYQKSAITLVSPAGKNTKACTFERINGQLTMGKNEPSAVTFSVQTASIATSEKKLNEKLEKDFLETQKFPVAEFQSTKIQKDSANANPNAYTVSGNLSFRGKKLPLNIPANIEMKEDAVEVMIQLPVTHKDWLENFSTAPDVFFTDQMNVVAKLVFPKPGAQSTTPKPITTSTTPPPTKQLKTKESNK